jgi:fructose-1-phosphate kinase PfkB-like protein
MFLPFVNMQISQQCVETNNSIRIHIWLYTSCKVTSLKNYTYQLTFHDFTTFEKRLRYEPKPF